jgi:hypothetical protein
MELFEIDTICRARRCLTLSFFSPAFIPSPMLDAGGFLFLIKRLAAAGFRL